MCHLFLERCTSAAFAQLMLIREVFQHLGNEGVLQVLPKLRRCRFVLITKGIGKDEGGVKQGYRAWKLPRRFSGASAVEHDGNGDASVEASAHARRRCGDCIALQPTRAPCGRRAKGTGDATLLGTHDGEPDEEWPRVVDQAPFASCHFAIVARWLGRGEPAALDIWLTVRAREPCWLPSRPASSRWRPACTGRQPSSIAFW